MEVPRAMQTFPESGLRAAAASGRDGVPDHIRSDNAALRAVAAAHQHDPATQCLGLPAPGASRRGSPGSHPAMRQRRRSLSFEIFTAMA